MITTVRNDVVHMEGIELRNFEGCKYDVFFENVYLGMVEAIPGCAVDVMNNSASIAEWIATADTQPGKQSGYITLPTAIAHLMAVHIRHIISSWHAEVEQLHEAQEAANTREQALREQLRDTRDDVAFATLDIADDEDAIADLRKKLAVSDSTVVSLFKQIDTLRETTWRQGNALLESERIIADLRAKQEVVRDGVALLSQQAGESIRENDRYEEQLNRLGEKHADLEDLYRENLEVVDKQAKEIGAMQNTITEQNQALAYKNEQMDRLEKDNQRLNSQVGVLESLVGARHDVVSEPTTTIVVSNTSADGPNEALDEGHHDYAGYVPQRGY